MPIDKINPIRFSPLSSEGFKSKNFHVENLQRRRNWIIEINFDYNFKTLIRFDAR